MLHGTVTITGTHDTLGRQNDTKSITVVHRMINVYCALCTGHWLLRSKAIRCYKVNWRSGTHSERDREAYIIHFHICSQCMSYIYDSTLCMRLHMCGAMYGRYRVGEGAEGGRERERERARERERGV